VEFAIQVAFTVLMCWLFYQLGINQRLSRAVRADDLAIVIVECGELHEEETIPIFLLFDKRSIGDIESEVSEIINITRDKIHSDVLLIAQVGVIID